MADKWEYKHVYVAFTKDDDFADNAESPQGWAKVDELGREGWEAVGIASDVGTTGTKSGISFTVTRGLHVLLKRRKL